jgi:hypothetical protein
MVRPQTLGQFFIVAPAAGLSTGGSKAALSLGVAADHRASRRVLGDRRLRGTRTR